MALSPGDQGGLPAQSDWQGRAELIATHLDIKQLTALLRNAQDADSGVANINATVEAR